MNYTYFEIKNKRLEEIFDSARKDIESWGNLKLPIIDKTNPKYNIDLSDKVPTTKDLYYTKISFEVVFDPVVDITFFLSNSPSVKVRVGEDIVKQGFFVKDLYLSLIGGDSFTYANFLKTLSKNDSIFVSYGLSFLKFGILIYIPSDIDNLNLTIKKIGNESVLGSFYNMLYVGENTNIRIYEDILSSNNDKKFLFELQEVILGPNSSVKHNIFQNIDTNSEYFVTRKLTTGGNNNIEFNDVSLGAIYQRIDDRIFMENRNVELKYTGIYFTKGEQKYDILVNARHRGLDQGADVIVKGVLDDKSKVYFNGVLKVEEKLKGINSFLGGHSLHLSNDCKSDSIPSLEIDSFDVKSGHAASLTQLDEEKLFYMMSRGLSEEEARKAIVQGFIEGAIRRINDDEFKVKIKKSLKDKGLEVVDIDLEVFGG